MPKYCSTITSVTETSYPGAAFALRERRPAVVERWLAGYARSTLRIPRPVDLRELRGLAGGIAEALATGLAEPTAAPGAAALREAEKSMAFAGGSLGMSGAGAFDVAAFVFTLRDALIEEAGAAQPEKDALARLCDWFCALALESYSSSLREAQRMRYRESLERGTPVVMLTPDLPAALLVGEPDRTVFEATFGRLILAVVRVGARALVLDGSGLDNASAPEAVEALGAFARHRKMTGVTVVLSGLPPDVEERWRATFPPDVPALHEERFEDAFARAQAIVQRRA